VAFDYMKAALTVLADDVSKNLPEDNKIKITVNHMLRIFE